MFLLYFSYCGGYLYVLNELLFTFFIRNKGFNNNNNNNNSTNDFTFSFVK